MRDGQNGSADLREPLCPKCHRELPVTGICDDHGRTEGHTKEVR